MLRQLLRLLLLCAVLFFGWRSFVRAGQETAVLHTGTLGSQDYYATLWLVDDPPFVWLRAEDRRERWLAAVQAQPEVQLIRGGKTILYRATPFDRADARARVDAMFRAKYGLADRVRELFGPGEALPIRLERR